MYADAFELLVFAPFSTVCQRAEKSFRHAEKDAAKIGRVFLKVDEILPAITLSDVPCYKRISGFVLPPVYKSAWMKYHYVPAFPEENADPHRFPKDAPQSCGVTYAE